MGLRTYVCIGFASAYIYMFIHPYSMLLLLAAAVMHYFNRLPKTKVVRVLITIRLLLHQKSTLYIDFSQDFSWSPAQWRQAALHGCPVHKDSHKANIVKLFVRICKERFKRESAESVYGVILIYYYLPSIKLTDPTVLRPCKL